MSDYEFSLSRVRGVVVLACLGLTGILLFSAGMVTGLLIEKPPAIPPVIVPVEKPAPKTQPTALPAQTAPPPTAPTAPAVTTAKPEVKNGLLVQVASFRTKVRADRLADSLRREGFTPVTVAAADVEEETWHVVRIGPYPDWDSATQAAASIDKTFSVRSRLLTPEPNSSN